MSAGGPPHRPVPDSRTLPRRSKPPWLGLTPSGEREPDRNNSAIPIPFRPALLRRDQVECRDGFRYERLNPVFACF